MHQPKAGFTLLELSVVLAIVGLLVGGIMGGQSLLRTSRINQMGIDAVRYRTAALQFREKYEYWPGDFPRATELWGRADGGSVFSNCASPYTVASVGNATCNGNGSGIIDGWLNNEVFRAWQHLTAGGFISGAFTGISNSSSAPAYRAGQNAPAGSMNSSGYLWISDGEQRGASFFYDGNYDNTITIGSLTAGNATVDPLFRTREALALDTKYDDGKPSTGDVRSFTPAYYSAGGGTCTSGTTTIAAVYALSSKSDACILIFRDTFHAVTAQ
jgi:prepilin-type N-terminal cleavage/methylation domain-containing protein